MEDTAITPATLLKPKENKFRGMIDKFIHRNEIIAILSLKFRLGAKAEVWLPSWDQNKIVYPTNFITDLRDVNTFERDKLGSPNNNREWARLVKRRLEFLPSFLVRIRLVSVELMDFHSHQTLLSS